MTEDYTKLVGKEVEANIFNNDDWFKAIFIGEVYRWADVAIGKPQRTFEVEVDGHKMIVSQIRPIRKFKKGDRVLYGVPGEEGTVIGFGDNDSKVWVHLWNPRGIFELAEDILELYEEPEKIEVRASKDMKPEEKLEKVKEFAKALGVDVNEIVGKKGCVGLVVRK
jgi:hypothetical protein